MPFQGNRRFHRSGDHLARPLSPLRAGVFFEPSVDVQSAVAKVPWQLFDKRGIRDPHDD
jgi:hypothetical protein